jgi:hypothetical protein
MLEVPICLQLIVCCVNVFGASVNPLIVQSLLDQKDGKGCRNGHYKTDVKWATSLQVRPAVRRLAAVRPKPSTQIVSRPGLVCKPEQRLIALRIGRTCYW